MKLFEITMSDDPFASPRWLIYHDGSIKPSKKAFDPDSPNDNIWQSGVNIFLNHRALYVQCCKFLTPAAKQALLTFMKSLRGKTISTVQLSLYKLDTSNTSPNQHLTPLKLGGFDFLNDHGPKAVRRAAAYLSQQIKPLEHTPNMEWGE